MVFHVMHCHFHLKIMHLASVRCQLQHHQPIIKMKKKIGRKKERLGIVYRAHFNG